MNSAAASSAHAHIRFAADIVFALNGEDPQTLAERIERAVYEAVFGTGLITACTKAQVDEHHFDVVLLSKMAAGLDREAVTAWLQGQMEGGHIPLIEFPAMMARLMLEDPADVRNELAERMGEGEADGAVDEELQCVVDQLDKLGKEFGFQLDRDTVRGAIEEAAGMLSFVLTEEQIVKACDAVLQRQEEEQKYEDGEVLGLDADGSVIQWDAQSRSRVNTGESLEDFGTENLSPAELQRVGAA